MRPHRLTVGAHYGLRDWIVQRISAVVIALYAVWLVVELLLVPELTYGNWAGLFGSMRMKVLTSVAMLALAWHAWIGARDIYMDYIKPALLRLLLEAATVVALVGYVIWAVTILWRI